MHIVPAFTLIDGLAAIVIAVVYILLAMLIPEPQRRQVSAVILAGAGAAYLSNGLGLWEIAFCVVMTVVAFRGLSDYRWIAVGW